jgi:hypothetical protein
VSEDAYLKRRQAICEHIMTTLYILGDLALLNKALDPTRLRPHVHFRADYRETSAVFGLSFPRQYTVSH